MPYDSTDYVTSAATFTDLKSQYSVGEDFSPLSTYSQSKTSNETYTSVVTTRTDSDGSVSQSLQIISKK